MAIYVVADPQFYNQKVAERRGLTVEEHNKSLIDNWNKTITDDEDVIILMGDISDGNYTQTKELFLQLTGKKKLIDFKDGKFSRLDWEGILNSKPWCVNGAVSGDINGERAIVVILSNLGGIEKMKETGYCAAANSLTHQNTIYKDRVLNLSIENWGYAPIAYMAIPEMIDNMLLFESMNEEEKNLNE